MLRLIVGFSNTCETWPITLLFLNLWSNQFFFDDVLHLNSSSFQWLLNRRWNTFLCLQFVVGCMYLEICEWVRFSRKFTEMISAWPTRMEATFRWPRLAWIFFHLDEFVDAESQMNQKWWFATNSLKFFRIELCRQFIEYYSWMLILKCVVLKCKYLCFHPYLIGCVNSSLILVVSRYLWTRNVWLFTSVLYTYLLYWGWWKFNFGDLE